MAFFYWIIGIGSAGAAEVTVQERLHGWWWCFARHYLEKFGLRTASARKTTRSEGGLSQ
jgi:hypothetical protein